MELAQLAQAYIHLKPYAATEKRFTSLGRYAELIAAEAASDIYGGDVVVEIELEEGSLVARVTVVGLLLGLYGGIADYKGFKESVVEMCDDAREFAVDVCGPFTKKASVPKEEIYRFERRLKTPGKLYRISRRLEKLERSATDLSPKSVQKELSSLRAELDAVAADLTTEELAAVEKGLVRSKKMPAPSQWPAPEPRAISRRDEDADQPQLFGGDTKDPLNPKNRIVFRSSTFVTKKLKLRRAKPKNEQLLPEG